MLLKNPLGWKDYLIGVLCVVLALALWFINHIKPAPVATAVAAVPAREVMRETKTTTPVAFKSIKTYPKAVKQKLNLPAAVQAADNVQVIEASAFPADDHAQTVTTVIDVTTGETSTFVRRDPLPWIAADYGGDAGVYLGIRNGSPAVRLEARQGVLTVKAIHFGVIGSVDVGALPASAFFGGGAWGQW